MVRLLVIFLLLNVFTPLFAQVAVIHVAVPDEPVDHQRVTSLLLGRSTTWKDGSPVTLILAADPAADLHLSHIIGRDRSLLMRGWKRLVFGGSGSMPVEATSVANALELVGRTPGAVALLDNAPPDPRWRVIPIMVTAGR